MTIVIVFSLRWIVFSMLSHIPSHATACFSYKFAHADRMNI